MSELEKLKKELNEVLERYANWCDRVNEKQILFRNTPGEIAELDNEIKREIIMPIIAKIKWLELDT